MYVPPQPTSKNESSWKQQVSSTSGLITPTAINRFFIHGILHLLKVCRPLKLPFGSHHSLARAVKFLSSFSSVVILFDVYVL